MKRVLIQLALIATVLFGATTASTTHFQMEYIDAIPEPSTLAVFGIFLAVGAGCHFHSIAGRGRSLQAHDLCSLSRFQSHDEAIHRGFLRLLKSQHAICFQLAIPMATARVRIQADFVCPLKMFALSKESCRNFVVFSHFPFADLLSVCYFKPLQRSAETPKTAHDLLPLAKLRVQESSHCSATGGGLLTEWHLPKTT